jgi:Adenosine-deaminase (editase) domain
MDGKLLPKQSLKGIKPRCAVSSVRHAEKRRTSTCRFADRIAQFCVDHYREHVPSTFREEQKQTCMAAVVAFVDGNAGGSGVGMLGPNNFNKIDSGVAVKEVASHTDVGRFFMLGLGVGTKFLSRELLDEETKYQHDSATKLPSYGAIVRDCHAEVLARRAFRRQLLLLILQDIDSDVGGESLPILQRVSLNSETICYGLRPGVSLHMFTSSAPCGNATLKKFATMKQERFREDLGNSEWPNNLHEPMVGHSIQLGQFALLVKRDSMASNSASIPTIPCPEGIPDNSMAAGLTIHSQKKRPRDSPALQSTDWCPPGTSTVWSGQGSLHTCSDKICRWNCLGWQGSLLASLMQCPIHISSLTVGRKLTEVICRRAVCCRAETFKPKKKERRVTTETENTVCQVNHPAIMGTAVYMDDGGVIEMTAQGDRVEGQDVRFHSTLSWAWWPSITHDNGPTSADEVGTSYSTAECIDGATGLAVSGVISTAELGASLTKRHGEAVLVSRISTAALLDLYIRVMSRVASESNAAIINIARPNSLLDLREFKKKVSPEYEAQKNDLLTKHPLFCHWKRREHHTMHDVDDRKTTN